jgi:hypothetical protein
MIDKPGLGGDPSVRALPLAQSGRGFDGPRDRFRVLFAFPIAVVLIEPAASDQRLPARADTVYRKR